MSTSSQNPTSNSSPEREAAKARVRAKVDAASAMSAREYVYNLLSATRTHAEAEAMLAEIEANAPEVDRLRAELAQVAEFCATRAEYIDAINNCSPSNDHDYWRWQRHAESRRQLSQTLGLPVGWPAGYEQDDAAKAVQS